MREVEFNVPLAARLNHAAAAIEAACGAEGLAIGMKGTPASFPGSTHWHFKRPRERGTLEITLFPRDRRIWEQIQAGRRADWIEPCIRRIKLAVEVELNVDAGSAS